MKSPLLALSAFLVASVSSALAVTVGSPAPEFTLTDHLGKPHSLASLKGKVVVLEWTNPECPFVVKHYDSGNIPRLQKAAANDGVVWLTINSGRKGAQGDYSDAEVSKWLQSTGAAPVGYLRDASGEVGKAYKAKVTPHLFVIDREGRLAYEGAIDSIRSTKKDDVEKAENYVVTALRSIKDGKPIERANTAPYGCGIKY